MLVGINDAGQVVGSSYCEDGSGGAYHAFITGPDGMGMRDLGTLGGIFPAMLPASTTRGRWWVRLKATGGYNQHAFITSPNGMGMRDLVSSRALTTRLWHQRCGAGSGILLWHDGSLQRPCFHDRPQRRRHDGPQFAG